MLRAGGAPPSPAARRWGGWNWRPVEPGPFGVAPTCVRQPAGRQRLAGWGATPDPGARMGSARGWEAQQTVRRYQK